MIMFWWLVIDLLKNKIANKAFGKIEKALVISELGIKEIRETNLKKNQINFGGKII